MSRTILTTELAERAVKMVLPAVMALIESKAVKRGDLHIVIADPGYIPSNENFYRWQMTGILYEHSLGDPEKWEHSYQSIARSKTELSCRYKMPTQIIQERCPHLLGPGDTVCFGSAVSDGLVVGVSGVEPYFDQMIAAWVLEACRAVCIEACKKNAVRLDESECFVQPLPPV